MKRTKSRLSRYEMGQAIAETFKEHWLIIVVGLVLVIGMIFGAVYARSAENTVLEKLDFIFFSNYKTRISQTLFTTFTSSVASSFLFLLLCFLSGMSLWGSAFVPLILFFRGFGLGLTSGYIYAFYGFKGILFNAIVILPSAFLSSVCVIFAARESIRYSVLLAAAERSRHSNETDYTVRTYLNRYALLLILLLGSGVLDVICTACFAGIFSL